MKRIRIRTILVFSVAAMAGASLLHTSQDVQKAEAELAQIQNDVNREQDSIRVLKTEWAFLNNPGRLETLARQYLKLSPSDPNQIKTDGAEIPVRLEDLPTEGVMQAQPVSYTPTPTRKPALPATPTQVSSKPIPKEKSLDDLIEQISEGKE